MRVVSPRCQKITRHPHRGRHWRGHRPGGSAPGGCGPLGLVRFGRATRPRAVQRLQPGRLDPIVAHDLTHQEQAVETDFEVGDPGGDRRLESGHEAAVLGDIVRGPPHPLPAFDHHRTMPVEQGEAIPGRSRIAPRCPVAVEHVAQRVTRMRRQWRHRGGCSRRTWISSAAVSLRWHPPQVPSVSAAAATPSLTGRISS